MSKKQPTLFNKRVSGLLIAGALLFVLIVVVVRVPSLSSPDPVAVDTLPVSPRREVSRRPTAVFDAEAFKRTIIDNNLFRPLGWTPPRPVEPYRLISTILPRLENAPPKAIVQSTTGDQTYIVSFGDNLDAGTQIVDIQLKQVTLSTNGQKRTLRLNTAVTLNASAATRSPRRTIDTPHRLTPRPAPVNRARPAEMTTPPKPTERYRPPPLSEWQTPEGIPIHLGDARLKNPMKWGLHRR